MTERIVIETKETMHYETSHGVVPNSEATTTMVTAFKINDETHYGSYEWYDKETGGERFYAEGGLWFNDDMELEDFDGCFNLPPDLIQYMYENDYLDQWHIDFWAKSGRLTLKDEDGDGCDCCQ